MGQHIIVGNSFLQQLLESLRLNGNCFILLFWITDEWNVATVNQGFYSTRNKTLSTAALKVSQLKSFSKIIPKSELQPIWYPDKFSTAPCLLNIHPIAFFSQVEDLANIFKILDKSCEILPRSLQDLSLWKYSVWRSCLIFNQARSWQEFIPPKSRAFK